MVEDDERSYRLNGGKFVKASSKTVIYPFRNYLSLSSSANVKEEFGLLFDEEATGIIDVNGNVEAAKGFYSVNGVKQTELRKGVNIVRMQDGTVKKILKK